MRVTLLSYTGDAEDLCEICAKSCYSEDGASQIKNTECKSALINAIKSGHESVLEHASYTFSIEGISRVCSHQLIRHRVASYSQQSQRYAGIEDGYVVPKSVKDMGDEAEEIFDSMMGACKEAYNTLIELGIPEEDARYIVPSATCTNIVVTMNARALRNFFKLRMCNRAQWEIRCIARTMHEICCSVSPMLFENMGASCDVLGYCPEKNSCGKRKSLKSLIGEQKDTT